MVLHFVSFHIKLFTKLYVIVVTWMQGIHLICVPEARAYISDKSQVSILQIIRMYHFQHSKNQPKLTIHYSAIYIIMGICCDYGIFILLLPWCLFIQCIAVVLIVGFYKNMCYSFTQKLVFKIEINGEFNKYSTIVHFALY